MLEVYSNGLCCCSVCTDLTSEKEIEKKVNIQNPTGIESQWTISPDKFKDGHSNPCPCETHKDRKHYLLIC